MVWFRLEGLVRLREEKKGTEDKGHMEFGRAAQQCGRRLEVRRRGTLHPRDEGWPVTGAGMSCDLQRWGLGYPGSSSHAVLASDWVLP